MPYEDLTGKTIGKYECIEFTRKDKNSRPYYRCRCVDCGWEGEVVYQTIIDSPNHPKCSHKFNYDEFVGKDIGRYHILGINHEEVVVNKNNSKTKRVYFDVVCNRCGMPAIVSDSEIRGDMYNKNLDSLTRCSHNVDESKLVGMQFGKYKITKTLGREKGRIIVEAVCTRCGFTKNYRLNDLRERANDLGETCTHKYTWYKEKELEESGEELVDKSMNGMTIGKYTVIQFLSRDEYGHKIYFVRCNKCGWEGNMVDYSILQSKDTTSCSHVVKPNTIWSTSRLGYIYDAMIDRCYNPNNVNYPNYGAKGIKVCSEWYDPNDPNNFIGKRNFNKFAVTNGYSDSLSIDRIDPDKDYSPENVHFTTRKYNSIFRSNVTVIHIVGNGIDIPATINGWEKILNLTDGTISRMFNESLYPDPAIRYYNMVNFIVNTLDPNAPPASYAYRVYDTKPIGYDFQNSSDLYPVKK